MKSTSHKLLLLVVSCLAIFPPAFGESNNRQPAPAPGDKEKSNFYFLSSLLPTVFQSRPLLAITVITECSDAGKNYAPPTLEKPAYYLIQSMGYHHEGHGVSDMGKVSEEYFQKFVETALSNSHYLPANQEHPAKLALFYFWGVHSNLETEDIGDRNFISRAQLVGGAKFAHEFATALRERAVLYDNEQGGTRIEGGVQSGVITEGSVGGDGRGGALKTMDPVYLFSIRSDLNRSLVDQVIDDCYYVVVSAYDAAALAKGQRILLWRTKMSTPAQGVSLAETTPALIASGGPFFGRPMTEPAIVDKRIDRKGNVGLGELKVITMDEKPTVKSSPQTPTRKK